MSNRENSPVADYATARDVEIAAWRDLYQDAPKAVREELGLSVETKGDAVVFLATSIVHPMLNRAIATTPSASPAALGERFDAHRVPEYFVQRRRGPDPFAGDARVAAYRRNWIKLAGDLPAREASVALAPAQQGLMSRVEDVGSAHAAQCAELFCRGFDLPPAAAPIFAHASEHPRFRVLAVFDGAMPVGVGYLYLGHRVAYLAGGVTAPGHRKRGIQAALVCARVRAAAVAGALVVTSETGEPAPGDMQHSQRNLERFGLEVVGVTENIAPLGMVWDHGAKAASAPCRPGLRGSLHG